MSFRPCALIPSHNHHRALPEVVAGARAHGLPVLIIDDGSIPESALAIAALHDPEQAVQVHRLPVNSGKGIAVTTGFHLAAEQGFTHAVQIDADGQHDLAALPILLEQARCFPQALISGRPLYDSTAPLGRRIGRWVTHIWVFIETLSLRISDSMCGFRVYPLSPCLSLLEEERLGSRMDFDTDIMVRLFWQGVPPVMIPVHVTYPPDNTSNFDVWRDNVRISMMHTRLVLTMLIRLPRILRHRPAALATPPAAEDHHWAGLAERGALHGLRLSAALYRWLGHSVCMALLLPVILYFHLTGSPQREASRRYLARVLNRPPTRLEGFRHTADFAARALDTLGAWTGTHLTGNMTVETPATLEQAATDPRGGLLVVSHHGNVDVARALMAPALRDRLTILVHTRHAENFNRVLRDLAPDAAMRLVQVTEIGPEMAIALQERVERGEWIAIAGDRIPVSAQGRTVTVPFLGSMAPFSQGPWILAALLGCPVYLLFCRRDRPGQWRLRLEPFADAVSLPRNSRPAALTALAARYAARLEQECRDAPRQWYNFFAYWPEDKPS